ncbi:uncharacterized protein B0H18DRAFT_1021997, partial [Fomitopsis serialis]|uniref:uncharacterized protein n=1 Tax=Fomitopsis serialis TaxID=139415 RepID=UPI0020085D01
MLLKCERGRPSGLGTPLVQFFISVVSVSGLFSFRLGFFLPAGSPHQNSLLRSPRRSPVLVLVLELSASTQYHPSASEDDPPVWGLYLMRFFISVVSTSLSVSSSLFLSVFLEAGSLKTPLCGPSSFACSPWLVCHSQDLRPGLFKRERGQPSGLGNIPSRPSVDTVTVLY